MGLDIIPSSVSNDTEPRGLYGDGVWLVVVDGDIRNSQWPPKKGDFYNLPPGADSATIVRSIDAFGAYNKTGAPLEVVYGGKKSSWWKIPDGMTCSVSKDSEGVLRLKVSWGPFGQPESTTASGWNYQGL